MKTIKRDSTKKDIKKPVYSKEVDDIANILGIEDMGAPVYMKPVCREYKVHRAYETSWFRSIIGFVVGVLVTLLYVHLIK